MVKDIHGRIRSRILPTLAVVCCFALFSGIVARAEGEDTGIPKSEAVTVHEPVHYVYDYKEPLDRRIKCTETEETYANWNQMPLLLPGDEVEIRPDLPTVEDALENRNVDSGMGGAIFADCTAEDKYPIKVTKSVSLGEPVRDYYGSTFIRKFVNEGPEPVKIVSNESGGYTSEKKTVSVGETTVEVTLNYYANWLGFKYYPVWNSVGYQYVDSSTNEEVDPEEIHFYGEAENPDAIWAVDAIHNYFNPDDLIKLSVNRPYAEGYAVSRLQIHTWSMGYNQPLYDGVFDAGTDTTKITPRWADNGGSISQGYTFKLHEKEDGEWTALVFTLSRSRTLTLEACGGTIDGLSSRIYNAQTNDQINEIMALEEDGKLVPKREGYFFAGWYEDENCETKVVSFEATLAKYSDFFNAPREDHICRVYAKWLKGWVDDGGFRYYYDENGPVTGWQTIGDNKYYFNEDGVMQTGRKSIGGKKYYFNKDGEMQTGLQSIDGEKYYFGTDGVMQTGKMKISGKWYYFGTGGTLQKGLVQLQSKWYCFGDDGAMIIGWGKYKNKYYFGSKDQKTQGELKTGWLQDGKKWYFMSKDSKTRGQMMTGWVRDGKKWYFMSKDSKTLGQMMTGWLQDGKNWYFLKADGSMAANEYCKGYWLDSDGRWTYKRKASWKKDKTGWWFGDGKWYAKSCTLTIDGKKYSFNAKGYLK